MSSGRFSFGGGQPRPFVGFARSWRRSGTTVVGTNVITPDHQTEPERGSAGDTSGLTVSFDLVEEQEPKFFELTHQSSQYLRQYRAMRMGSKILSSNQLIW